VEVTGNAKQNKLLIKVTITETEEVTGDALENKFSSKVLSHKQWRQLEMLS
jgi:hypothetical protein